MKNLFSFILVIFSISAYGETFNKIIEKSVENHYEFIKEKADLEVARTYKMRAVSQFLPTISLVSGEYKTTTGGEESKFKRQALEANMNLFRFGGDGFKIKAAHASKNGQVNKIFLKRFSLEKEISIIIFSYLETKSSFDIYKKIVNIRKESVRIAKKRYRAGQLSLQDYQKVRIDLNNAMGDLADIGIRLSNFKQRMYQFTGVRDVSFSWPWERLSPSEIFLRNEVDLKEHPLNKYSYFNEQSNNWTRKGSFLTMLGGVDLNFSKGVNDYSTGEIEDERLSVSLTIPLFNKFSDYFSYKSTKSSALYAKALRVFNTRKVRSTFDTAKENLAKSFETYTTRKETLKVSSKLFQNTQAQFKKGRITVNNFLIEQDRLLRTQILSNSGAKQYQEQIINYCHAIGRSIINSCL